MIMEKSRIVVSGVNGFVGHHLAEKLHSDNVDVIGIGSDLQADDDVSPFLAKYYSADLTQSWPNVTQVDAVIHLAGLAAVGPSFDNPQLYIDTNSSMVTHLGEFYLKQEKKPRVIVVSSGAIYDAQQPMPLNESSAAGLSSPYAVSKVLTENQAAYYRQRGLDCVVVRPFNHIGPGQKPGFIVPDLYKQLVEARTNNETEVKVGNLESRRDYTDVRDIVAAYALLATAPNLSNFVYNVSSGKSYSGNDILNELKAGLDLEFVTTSVDPSKFRPTDAAEITGDSSRLQNETGWQPSYSLHQTIVDFIASQQSSGVETQAA
jgi:GDP-4-dehydro-6-deoxy-D-mannose reductase